jgi:hypothetical protein
VLVCTYGKTVALKGGTELLVTAPAPLAKVAALAKKTLAAL